MSDHRFGIVVGVDGSPSSAAAVSWAARDAGLRNLTLTLVHAVPSVAAAWPMSILTRMLGRPPVQRASRILDDALAVLDDSRQAAAPPKVITRVALADPVAGLVELSRDAELVVVGARGAGAVRRALYGSVSSEVVRRSHCAVAVIHDEDPLMPHPLEAPVLVGVGAAAASQQARTLARQEALRRGVTLIEVPVSVPISKAGTDRLVQQSESAQLVVVGDRAAGVSVARSARMPVIITR